MEDDTVTLEEWVNAACGAVVEAMRDGSIQRRTEVAHHIGDVQGQLPAELEDLAAFLSALRGLLAGQPPALMAAQLDNWYAEVLGRVVDAIEEPPPDGHAPARHEHDHPHPEPHGQPMSLGEALEYLADDAIRVMRDGSREDRAQMAQSLEVLRFQTLTGMDWPAFAEFLQALQNLLRGNDVGNTDFESPFDQAWAVINDQLPVDSDQ